MCSRRGHPLRGKVPNHKNSQCQCFSQGPVLLQNGETYYNPDANSGAQHAIEGSKALHARRWQTKDGTYHIKGQALPDVRDAPLDYDNAAASIAQMPIQDGRTGMKIMLWDINFILN